LQNIQERNNSGQIWDRLARAPFKFKCHKQGMNSILLTARSNKQIAGACHGNITCLGKVAHSGDVTVWAEGQPAVLGQVTLCCEVVVLATFPSLTESLLESLPVFTGVIAGHAGVVTMLHVHCGQHIFDLVAMAPLPL
jgi:hypothetical protein